jgi:hypothetical protein
VFIGGFVAKVTNRSIDGSKQSLRHKFTGRRGRKVLTRHVRVVTVCGVSSGDHVGYSQTAAPSEIDLFNHELMLDLGHITTRRIIVLFGFLCDI